MGGKGVIVHFTGNILDPNTKLRMDGVAKAVAETNGQVTLLTTIANIDTTLQGASEKIDALLAAHGSEIDGIVSTAWIPTVAAATALERSGTKRIKMVGIDDDPVVIKAILDGYVSGSIMQNNYGQAYIASYALKEIVGGCKVNPQAPWSPNPYTAHFIDSEVVYADAPMIATYMKAHPGTQETDLEGLLSMSVTNQLMQTFKGTYLLCP
jgi:ribose transport system substrate-binding protein